LGEGNTIVDGHFSQYLAIDGDARCLEAIHKAAVGKASLACGGVDTRNPEAAHIALAVPPIAVLVTACLEGRLICRAPETASPILVSFGRTEDLFVASMEPGSALYSHVLFPFQGYSLLAVPSSLPVQGEEGTPHRQV
jgi:hypothetical protein